MYRKKNIAVVLIFAIISTLLFLSWATVRIVKSVQMSTNCTQYLQRAADANTVDLAKNELAKAISYAEEHNLTEGVVSIFLKQPKNDIGFWYKNMKEAYQELDNLPSDTTSLEKTNVLMKLRESLTEGTKNGTAVTIPEGISIYPNNVLYFLWGTISIILAFALTLWIFFAYLML